MARKRLQLGRRPLKKRSRLPDSAVPHSLNHWIRVEAQAICRNGAFSVSEIAEKIGEDVKLVTGHVRDLYESGSLEIAAFKKVGNHTVALYRAIQLPVVTDEVYAKMTPEERHDACGALVQGVLAESISSFRNKKKDDACLVWDASCLDAQGRREMRAHLADSWRGAVNIHGRSANRMAESGEKGTSFIMAFLGFERGRPGRPKGGYRMEKYER